MTYLRRLYYRIYWLFHKRPVYVPPVKRWIMLEGGKRNGEVVETSEGIHTIICFERTTIPNDLYLLIDYNITEVSYREDPEREGIFVYQEKEKS